MSGTASRIRVVVESPYAGDVEKNVNYTRECVKDCIINHYENPYASHLFFTQEGILDDLIAEERKLGIEMGFAWGELAEKTVVYCDLGMSKGMKQGVIEAKKKGRPIEIRYLYGAN